MAHSCDMPTVVTLDTPCQLQALLHHIPAYTIRATHRAKRLNGSIPRVAWDLGEAFKERRNGAWKLLLMYLVPVHAQHRRRGCVVSMADMELGLESNAAPSAKVGRARETQRDVRSVVARKRA